MGEVKFSLQAGVRARWQTPVSVVLDGEGVSALQRGEAAVPCQSRALGDGKCELSFILDRLPAGGKAEYVATLGAPAQGDAMTVLEEGPAVALLQHGHEISKYYFAEPSAARPFWYPLPDPYGTPITRGYPLVLIDGEKQDHPHHRSLWVAYGEVNETDNWSEQEGHATQSHEGWNALESGAVYALLDHQVCWRSNTGAPVLDERRVWKVYNLGASGRLWEVAIDLTPAAGVGDVTFGDTKEGGLLSVRVATSMDVPKGRIENSAAGIDEGETWGKRAHWCDYSGPVGNNWVGIAVLDHPDSFRHPTWWHVRNYGLMTANCFGLSHFTSGQANGSYVLPAGQTMKFRYRVYIHPGDAKAGDVAGKYHDYAHPPQVKIES